MLSKLAEMLTSDVQVRRHNGQCKYGPWLMADDEDLPVWVRGLIADEIAESKAEEGIVSEGGEQFAWRKIEWRPS